MNILLWILQVLLAFFFVAGGQFKVFRVEDVVKMPAGVALPRTVWRALGVFEMLCAVLLVVPPLIHWMPVLTPLAAAAMALENLVLALIYARYSLALRATNPLVYVVIGGLMAAFVAYGRYALT